MHIYLSMSIYPYLSLYIYLSIYPSLSCRQQPIWVVSRGPHLRVARKGLPPPITLSVEKRQGNKVVTKISGLEEYLVDPDRLASELRTLLAGATTLDDAPGSSGKKRDVFVQGPHCARVADHLAAMYQVPRKYIDIKNSGKGKG